MGRRRRPKRTTASTRAKSSRTSSTVAYRGFQPTWAEPRYAKSTNVYNHTNSSHNHHHNSHHKITKDKKSKYVTEDAFKEFKSNQETHKLKIAKLERKTANLTEENEILKSKLDERIRHEKDLQDENSILKTDVKELRSELTQMKAD